MKRFLTLTLPGALLLAFMPLLDACESDVNPCDAGNDLVFTNQEGIVQYYEPYKRKVIMYAVPGTIDSMDVYVPCSLTDEFSDGTKVLFCGFGSELDRNDFLYITAGEKPYAVVLTSIETLKDP